jgi:IS30 family transposase
MSSIGRRFDCKFSSVFSMLSPSGGIRPPERRRAARTLSLTEREGGSRGLVERQSRYVILVKVANKQTATIVSAPIGQSRELSEDLCRSLTWDRGKELDDHRRLTLATEVEVYFCDSHSPWQRGTNENTYRLGSIPAHGIDLSTFSQTQLSKIARQLNERLRKTLNYETPAELFAKALALTG